MATRVTAAEVKDIIDTELSDSRIEAFIKGANTIVNEYLTDEGLSDDLLKEIERWLTAHYITSHERQVVSQEAGPVSQKFSDIFGKHLLSSTYGQTAAQMDTTGKLSALGQKKIRLRAIEEDYE